MAQGNRNHHKNCNQGDQNRHFGMNDTCKTFMERYNVQAPFDLECTGCCFAYLRGERNYEEVQGAQFDRVCFSTENLAEEGANMPLNLVYSFVKVSKNPEYNPQIITEPEDKLGKKTARAFAESRTYQLYSETRNLRVGQEAKARMESVTIDVVRGDELIDIYFKYADAALVELYRERRELPSLSQAEVTGYLLLRNPDSNDQRAKE